MHLSQALQKLLAMRQFRDTDPAALLPSSPRRVMRALTHGSMPHHSERHGDSHFAHGGP